MAKNRTGSIAALVSDFVESLTGAIEGEVFSRARDAVLSAVGGGKPAGRGPGRPAAVATRGPGRPPGRPRKKPPIQYCPVPGCKNRAAPVFGMVCSEHKDVAKSLIKKYRAQRKADRAKTKKGATKAAA
jgi:hypothetical protein